MAKVQKEGKMTACPKIKKVKKKSINGKKKEAWMYFARYIRKSANGVCFSCRKLVGFDNLDAGHFYGRKSSVLFMDERNVHAQCHTCNRFRGGNLGEYATRLCQKYGAHILLELYPLAYQTKKWTHDELDALIERYKPQ